MVFDADATRFEASAAFVAVITQSPALTPISVVPETVHTEEGEAVNETAPVPLPPVVETVAALP